MQWWGYRGGLCEERLELPRAGAAPWTQPVPTSSNGPTRAQLSPAAKMVMSQRNIVKKGQNSAQQRGVKKRKVCKTVL